MKQSLFFSAVSALLAVLFLFTGCASSDKSSTPEGKAYRKNRIFLSLNRKDNSRLKYLLRHGENPNAKDSRGTPILTLAAASGRIEMVKCLVEAGAKISGRDADGDTALHAAASGKSQEVLQYLAKRASSVDLKGKNRRTPLMLACLSGNMDSVRTLMDFHADFRRRDSRGASVLYYCAMAPCKPPSPVPETSDQGKGSKVQSNLTVEMMNYFEEKGLEKKYFQEVGSFYSPLSAALRAGNDPAAVWLLSWQDDFGPGSGREELGKELAIEASKRGSLPVVRALVRKKLCLNQDRTWIHKALIVFSADGIYKLFARYCIIPRRRTVLHEACLAGQADIAEFLVLSGANPYVVSNENETAFDYANDTKTYDAIKRAWASRSHY